MVSPAPIRERIPVAPTAGVISTYRRASAVDGLHLALRMRSQLSEETMAKKHGSSVKNDKKYEALRDKGYSKERSAKIANSGKTSSRKGGKNSH